MDQYKLTVGIAYFCSTVLLISADDACDVSKCPGPMEYYKDLDCKPVYMTPGDCCPYKYNCDHLKTRSTNKCYVNGHEYDIGEKLREEDKQPCDIDCSCRMGYYNVAVFNCAIVDCFNVPPKPGCYMSRNISQCCGGKEVCPENPEDRPKCTVDGKVYLDGEHFTPESEPNKNCICGAGYKGDNTKAFCREVPSVSPCRAGFHHAYEIENNCVPTYYYTQSPQDDCAVAFRCQNKDDKVVKKNKNTSPPQESDDMICKFGTMLMRYGDELNQATDYSSVCVRCVCEVGPVPTCQRLPDEECDVTKHPNFDNISE